MVDLGLTDLGACVALQEATRAEVLAGGAERIFVTSHRPVISLGRRASFADLRVSPEILAARGVGLERVTRGGLATAHGPGQLVIYPVVRLRGGVVAHVARLGSTVADWLRSLGIADAVYSREHVGVLAGGKKVAAIGVHVARGVAIHGLALNLGAEVLPVFALCVPCGRSELEPGCVSEVIAAPPPSLAVAARALVPPLARVLGLPEE
jgi:lipoate-protein ligase B